MSFLNMENLRDQGLLLWHPMDTASTSRDLSGNGLTGTNNATMYLVKANNGRYYYNFYPSGHIDIPGSALLDTQAITISVWVRVDTWTQAGFFFEKTVGGVANSEYSLFCTSGGTTIARTVLTSLTDVTITSPGKVFRWVHIVYTWDLTTRKMYYDTVMVGSAAWTSNHATNASGVSVVGIYGEVSGGGYPFTGDMRNLMIFNKALSAEQIFAIYSEQYMY